MMQPARQIFATRPGSIAPVMDHLHIMTRGTGAHILGARLTVFRLRGDRPQNRREGVPRLARPAGHERRPMQCALLTTRHAHTDEMKSGGLQLQAPAVGIEKE